MTSPAVVNPRHAAPAPILPGRTRRPSLTVVPTPHPRARRPAVALSLAMVVVFAALLAGAVVHSMLVAGQAHLDKVTTQTRAEAEQLETEQFRLAALSSPERITREAERLGMVPGRPDNWLGPDGSTVTEPALVDPSTDGAAEDPTAGDATVADDPATQGDPDPVGPPLPVADTGELAAPPNAAPAGTSR